MQGLKKPWIAAVLALALGGPGWFYLGWRRAAKATLWWLPFALFMLAGTLSQLAHPQDASFEPAVLFLFLLQGTFAWTAYRSCKRSNVEGAKAGGGVASLASQNPQRRAQADCSKEIRDVGLQVIALSGITLFGSLMGFVNTSPPMGGMGHFMHDSALVMVPMSVWGVATGMGLKRAWRWAWISMLVFGGLLATFGTLMTVPLLLMPGGGVVWWGVLSRKLASVLLFLVPASIGVRWFTFFMRSNVKAYFRIARKAPTALA